MLTALPAIAQIDTTAGQQFLDSLITHYLNYPIPVGGGKTLSAWAMLLILMGLAEVVSRFIPGVKIFHQWVVDLVKRLYQWSNRLNKK